MKKRMLIFISVIVIIGIIVGITFALIKKNVFSQNVSFNIDGLDAFIIYSKGTDVLTGTLDPVKNYGDTGVSTEITLYKNTSKTIYGHIYLDITSITNDLAAESALKWVIKSNGQVLNEGNFKGTKNNDSIPLKLNIPLTTTEQKFQIYIWLDDNMDINDAIEGQTLSTIVRAEASYNEYEVEPNEPALTDNLIPVKYDSANSRWVKADSSNLNNDWYDYKNKKWANAVLVGDNTNSDYATSNTIRATYTSASVGTPIPESDILAYYVWIPRYKYKVWNINKVIGTDSYSAETKGIDIKFENGKESSGTITCGEYSFAAISNDNTRSEECIGNNGDYYTHPAFTFGSNEVSGLWVGKFELSSENPSATNGGGNDINLTPRIKPNVTSWRYNRLSHYWKVIKNMQSINNIYGLTTNITEADSHMIKNSEWGAVAYFTHSKYGVCNNNSCEEVYKNNSNSFITGNSGTEVYSASISGTTLAYNENKKTTTVAGGNPLSLSNPTNDANYPWTQSNGIWSSGNAGVQNSSSKLIYSFTNSSNAVLKVLFSVSCYYSNKFRIYLDGTEIMTATDRTRGISEESLKYDTFLYNIASGSHTIEAVFDNYTTNVEGLDKAYIKSFEILEGATIEIVHSEEIGGQRASTTYNESGIYDMSGNAWEFVMANMSEEIGNYSYNVNSVGTQFSYDNTTSKYIDRYAYSDTVNLQTDYNRSTLGDATGELVKREKYGWNDDYSIFVESSNPWFLRGGHWWNDSNAGIFNFVKGVGSNSVHFSTRAVFAILE